MFFRRLSLFILMVFRFWCVPRFHKGSAIEFATSHNSIPPWRYRDMRRIYQEIPKRCASGNTKKYIVETRMNFKQDQEIAYYFKCRKISRGIWKSLDRSIQDRNSYDRYFAVNCKCRVCYRILQKIQAHHQTSRVSSTLFWDVTLRVYQYSCETRVIGTIFLIKFGYRKAPLNFSKHLETLKIVFLRILDSGPRPSNSRISAR